MFDIGIGEIVLLAVLGLLVFGPERLPKAAADAARMLKQVRSMAANARKDLTDSAGIDLSDAKEAFSSIADLHPRRIMQSVMTDDPEDDAPKPATNDAAQSAQKPAFDPDAT